MGKKRFEGGAERRGCLWRRSCRKLHTGLLVMLAYMDASHSGLDLQRKVAVK